MANIHTYSCPQRGEQNISDLHEGYCLTCFDNNQRELDRFNIEYDTWNVLNDEQRDTAINWELK